MSTALRLATLAPLLTFSAGFARDDVALRWHGKAGDVQRHRVTTVQKTQISAMPQAFKTEYTLVLRQEVKAVAPDGVGSLELHYEAFRMQAEGMMPIDYDSTRQGDEAKKNPADIASAFATLSAATIQVEIEPSGHLR